MQSVSAVKHTYHQALHPCTSILVQR